MGFELPSSIKIISCIFEVKKMPEYEKRKSDFLGLCRTNEVEILIDDRWKPQVQANTLLHEILHAISSQMGKLGLDDETEEKVVQVMANGICSVMRDNPKLFSLIQKGLE